jgi:hypothetical protein
LQGAGISDSVANTMIKYGAGLGAYVDSIGNSIAPTKEAIKSAQDLQDKWEQVKQTIQGIGNDSLPALDTALSPVLDHMNQFLQKMRDAEKATTGHAAPIPWGDWFRDTKSFFENKSLPRIGNFFDWSAHGAELPRASTGLSGEHSLKVHGQELSSSNPLPVDVVRNSIITPGGQGNGNYGDSASLLGGPIGSGGPLPGSGGGASPYVHGPGPDHGAPPGLRLRGSGSLGNWWTPDRIKHAVERLQKEAGLSEAGAAGLVARWSGIEAAGGPGSHNNIGGGHSGIGQWSDVSRGGAAMRGADFDTQIGHAIDELKTTEAQAAAVLRNAKTPEEGARGASMFERAEHYNPSTGLDDWTSRTPVGKVLDILHDGKRKNISELAAPGTTALGSPDQLNKGFGSGGWTFPAIAPYDKIPAATQPGGQLSPEKSSLLDYGIPSGGARLSSLAAINPVTTSSTSNSMHVVNHIDARGATDPHGIAREIQLALERSTSTMMAQSGQV